MRQTIVTVPLVLCVLVGALRSAPIDDLPAPIVTRQAVFSIPFTVPRVDATQQPAEVRLLASGDRGATWQITDRVDLRGQRLPYNGGFTFRAPADGEYWFAIRTADRAGRMRSEKGGVPELRVLVDTRPPRLDFSAEQGAAGEIFVRWQAFDPNLKPDSFKLQYQSTGNPRWQPIAIDAPPVESGRSTMSSSATWWPADASGMATIRAEVSDAAGNTAVAQARVDLQQSAVASGRPAWQERAPPTASMNRSVMSNDNRRQSGGAPSGSGVAAGASSINRSQFDSAGRSNVEPGFSRGTQWPPDARTELPMGRGSAQDSPSERGPISHHDRANTDEVGPVEGPALVRPLDGHIHPPIGRQHIAPSNVAEPTRPQNVAGVTGLSPGASSPTDVSSRQNTQPNRFDFVVPQGEQLRMVNSTAFELDYEVESVGRSGIAKVELWMTRDDGRTWSNVGADSDNRSPFRASVDREGVYGYRLKVQSGSGLGARPPQAGDPPEVWIGVDLTRPAAQLLSAEVGTGDRAGEVVIRYEASDALLASRPIALLQSAQAGGPWTTIAAGLNNTGQYTWRFDETAPQRIYLRLEVRDEAGNVGFFEAAEPVLLQRIVPQGRLRNVRPIGDSARLTTPREAFGGPAVRRQ